MKITELYGVFPFDPTNRYPEGTAVKTYQRRHAAEKFCDRLNDSDTDGKPDRGYVTRTIRRISEE